jgi:hypothetical protein
MLETRLEVMEAGLAEACVQLQLQGFRHGVPASPVSDSDHMDPSSNLSKALMVLQQLKREREKSLPSPDETSDHQDLSPHSSEYDPEDEKLKFEDEFNINYEDFHSPLRARSPILRAQSPQGAPSPFTPSSGFSPRNMSLVTPIAPAPINVFPPTYPPQFLARAIAESPRAYTYSEEFSFLPSSLRPGSEDFSGSNNSWLHKLALDESFELAPSTVWDIGNYQ